MKKEQQRRELKDKNVTIKIRRIVMITKQMIKNKEIL
jgi:hypothetical protein